MGLGRLAGLRGLGETTTIKAGSKARVGFRFSCAFCFSTNIETDNVANTVEGCLYATGAFTAVKAALSKGFIYQDYLTVEVTTSFDFGKSEDIGGFIQETLKQCYPDFAALIDSRDSVLIDAVPVGTPIPTYQVPGNDGGGGGKPPGACDKEKGLDYVACSLGLKPTSGVYVGALGAIGVFLLFAVVLKR